MKIFDNTKTTGKTGNRTVFKIKNHPIRHPAGSG